MVVGQRAPAHQRGDHRNAGDLGELQALVPQVEPADDGSFFDAFAGLREFYFRFPDIVLVDALLPLMSGVGKLCGVSKEKVRRSFIEINNQLVLAEARRVHPSRLLILLPQCLQFHECGVRITGNVKNCKACGKCKIKNLVELSDKYGVSISVATGGTLARKIVVDKKPQLIIGVACERDLTSGIQDTYPIPVFGILNRRPNGPCYDTDVDLELVEAQQRGLGDVAAVPCERDDARGRHAMAIAMQTLWRMPPDNRCG